MTIQSQPLTPVLPPQQPTQPGQLITESPVERPSAWMRDGQSPTEIILSVAILTTAALWGIALVLLATAQVMRVLRPQLSTQISQPDPETVKSRKTRCSKKHAKVQQ